MSTRINLIKIGWDLGGAHIKYCVESQASNVIWYDIIDFDFWRDYSKLGMLIKSICKKYHARGSLIENYFTMSAEMCDCFDNRRAGVKYILNQIKKMKYHSYIFSKHGLSKLNSKCNVYPDKIASYNWYASALYLSKLIDNAILIDFGSTTCDFSIIKNGKILNRRSSDIDGMLTKELLYTGCSRTPIYAHISEIRFRGRNYNIIPENFSSMSDVNIILGKLDKRDIYSKPSDGSNHSLIQSYKRICRSFGFDYDRSKRNLINYLCLKIYDNQVDLINKTLSFHSDKYFKRSKHVVIGLGLGSKIISNMCKQNRYDYLDIKDILNDTIVNGDYLSNLFPAFVLNRLSNEL
tara:strand:- start:1230 stop:2279 length:1050 start_codon:yes stop_codon:yes gene_type:complete